jgi:hypothetical protein
VIFVSNPSEGGQNTSGIWPLRQQQSKNKVLYDLHLKFLRDERRRHVFKPRRVARQSRTLQSGIPELKRKEELF